MKFRVTLKDPDGVDDSIDREVRQFMTSMDERLKGFNLSADEIDLMEEQHTAVVREYVHRWIKYGEYLTIEIDTDTGAATVVKP